MKRLSRREVVEGIQDKGYVLKYNDWFTLNAGWRVEDSERNIIGYVTDIDACYILNSFEPGELKKHSGYDYIYYTYNKINK